MIECIECKSIVSRHFSARFCFPCIGKHTKKYSDFIGEEKRYRKGKRGCLFCGEKEIRKLEIHHIDKNTSNNEKNNLEIFCSSCHKKLHRRIYDKLCLKEVE